MKIEARCSGEHSAQIAKAASVPAECSPKLLCRERAAHCSRDVRVDTKLQGKASLILDRKGFRISVR
jgi:hypothetical protein